MTDTSQELPREILHRIDGRVLYRASTVGKSLRDTVLEAIAARADLRGADLGGAYLGGAYLGGADLGGADLGGADLGGADLGGADLRGAYLRGAYLGGADLRGAYLRGAYLRGADLGGADLRGAYLGGADLGGADLGGADLRGAYLGGADEKKIALHALTRVAYAGPVGNCDRIVYGFLAEPDAKHKKPWLVLVCGCFTGDEEEYRARVAASYGAKEYAHYLAQCLAALVYIKALAAIWIKDAKQTKGGV